MGYFTLDDLPHVDLKGSNFYSLWIFIKFSDYQEALKHFRALETKLNQDVMKKHPEVSFFGGLSIAKPENSVKYKIKTGKRGRPKVTVSGDFIAPHIHLVCTGKGRTSALNDVKKYFDKKFAYKGVKISSIKKSDDPCIHYIDRQSPATLSTGDFDFTPMKSDFYYAS